MQEKAIGLREKAELKLINKMLKHKSVSPTTHERKKHHVEVWVNREKNKLDRNKKEMTDIFHKTLEMVETTKKNKEHIKRLLASSKTKRPDIWSEYGNDSL